MLNDLNRFLVRLPLLVATAACAGADVHAGPTDERVALFDGESLDGWVVSEENPGSFSVVDGAIVADGPRAHLFYDGAVGSDFTDFELTLKVQTAPNSNSGVFFHTRYQASGWPSHGFEAQVNATQHDVRKTGSVYAVADVRVYTHDTAKPLLGSDGNFFITLDVPPHADDEWFDYRIRVEGNTVSTWVNGRWLVSWQQPEDWPDEKRRLNSGTFALQAHDPDSIVRYKDIYVTRLGDR